MNNVFILQNEIENAVDKLVSQLGATDDERIIALQLALNTAYKVKNVRSAYAMMVAEKEKGENTDGNSDEER